MNPVQALQAFAFVGIPAGLAVGMGLGLVARREDGWGGYASLPRRAARLGHVAAVMLPALGGLYGLLLADRPFDGRWAAWGAALWIAGGVTLPVALFVLSRRPHRLWLLPGPALAVTLGAVCLALAALGGAP